MSKHNSDLYKPNPDIPLTWYYCDLDNTLADSVWPKSEGIGAPIIENIKKLQEVADEGYKIFVYTSRPAWHVEAIERWCKEFLLPYGIDIPAERIITGKPLAVRYIDDKNINARDASWL